MIAKISTINIGIANKYESDLVIHIMHEINRDNDIEIDSVREMVEVFKEENFNPRKYRNCKPERVKVLTGSENECECVYLLKPNAEDFAFYILLKIQFNHAIENSYKKPKLKAPPELIAWFDEVKNDKSSKTMAKMKSIRGQFKMIKGNTDPDHSLFRAKLSGRASVNYEEVVFAIKESGVSRAMDDQL